MILLPKGSFSVIKSISKTADYSHSANSLFHFMKREEYLNNILTRKALLPRYYIEKISYLNISDNTTQYHEIAVLQTCFCDIPLHQIYLPTQLSAQQDKSAASEDTSHVGIYGGYGIAFSKEWCESKGLQPIRYINPLSGYALSFGETVSRALKRKNLSQTDATDILYRLAFIKPLRGEMDRRSEDGKGIIHFQKNFFDEQEWRYVPSAEICTAIEKKTDASIPFVIAETEIINGSVDSASSLNEMSNQLAERRYAELGLTFFYHDIRYLIVPDSIARDKLIAFIQSLPEDGFEAEKINKHVLISRILVLDEIRKDW